MSSICTWLPIFSPLFITMILFLSTLLKISVNLFLGYFIPSINISIRLSLPHCLDCNCIVVSCEIGTCDCLCFILSFQDYFDHFEFLQFHMNSRNTLSILQITPAVNLIRIVLIFLIFSLPWSWMELFDSCNLTNSIQSRRI